MTMMVAQVYVHLTTRRLRSLTYRRSLAFDFAGRQGREAPASRARDSDYAHLHASELLREGGQQIFEPSRSSLPSSRISARQSCLAEFLSFVPAVRLCPRPSCCVDTCLSLLPPLRCFFRLGLAPVLSPDGEMRRSRFSTFFS